MSVRAAVIGTGFMGRTHLQAYRAVPGVELVGVVSRSRSEVDDVPAFATVAELVDRARPDLVSVCTPTALHPAAVRELAAAGVDIVCEKPLAGDVATARALLQECAERGVHLFVAHVLRHFEQYVRAREVASSGELGRVSTVRLRRAVPTPSGAEDWFRDADASGGVVLDLLIHDIDFLIGLFGAPAHVHARRRRVAETEHVGATLRFAGGELAFLEGSWGGVSALEYGCEIAGSAGNLAFDSAPRVPLRLERLDGGSVVEQPSNRDPYREQLADFVSRRSGPPAPDTDAVLAVLVCAALDESARSGRTVSLEEVS